MSAATLLKYLQHNAKGIQGVGDALAPKIQAAFKNFTDANEPAIRQQLESIPGIGDKLSGKIYNQRMHLDDFTPATSQPSLPLAPTKAPSLEPGPAPAPTPSIQPAAKEAPAPVGAPPMEITPPEKNISFDDFLKLDSAEKTDYLGGLDSPLGLDHFTMSIDNLRGPVTRDEFLSLYNQKNKLPNINQQAASSPAAPAPPQQAQPTPAPPAPAPQKPTPSPAPAPQQQAQAAAPSPAPTPQQAPPPGPTPSPPPQPQPAAPTQASGTQMPSASPIAQNTYKPGAQISQQGTLRSPQQPMAPSPSIVMPKTNNLENILLTRKDFLEDAIKANETKIGSLGLFSGTERAALKDLNKNLRQEANSINRMSDSAIQRMDTDTNFSMETLFKRTGDAEINYAEGSTFELQRLTQRGIEEVSNQENRLFFSETRGNAFTEFGSKGLFGTAVVGSMFGFATSGLLGRDAESGALAGAVTAVAGRSLGRSFMSEGMLGKLRPGSGSIFSLSDAAHKSMMAARKPMNMGLQTRHLTISGAMLGGVAFSNRKRRSRGFNRSRGNRF
jgi:outer membrane biosynthesis protein TonB